jgi:hypothetical protein
LNTTKPAFLATAGFGSFIPRSGRHWAFPSEFGVAFTGAPSVAVSTSGWVCTDAAQTMCSNVADLANPVGAQFHTSLQSQIQKWRKDADLVTVYPVFSQSIVYSFNIR